MIYSKTNPIPAGKTLEQGDFVDLELPSGPIRLQTEPTFFVVNPHVQDVVDRVLREVLGPDFTREYSLLTGGTGTRTTGIWPVAVNGRTGLTAFARVALSRVGSQLTALAGHDVVLGNAVVVKNVYHLPQMEAERVLTAIDPGFTGDPRGLTREEVYAVTAGNGVYDFAWNVRGRFSDTPGVLDIVSTTLPKPEVKPDPVTWQKIEPGADVHTVFAPETGIYAIRLRSGTVLENCGRSAYPERSNSHWVVPEAGFTHAQCTSVHDHRAIIDPGRGGRAAAWFANGRFYEERSSDYDIVAYATALPKPVVEAEPEYDEIPVTLSASSHKAMALPDRTYTVMLRSGKVVHNVGRCNTGSRSSAYWGVPRPNAVHKDVTHFTEVARLTTGDIAAWYANGRFNRGEDSASDIVALLVPRGTAKPVTEIEVKAKPVDAPAPTPEKPTPTTLEIGKTPTTIVLQGVDGGPITIEMTSTGFGVIRHAKPRRDLHWGAL